MRSIVTIATAGSLAIATALSSTGCAPASAGGAYYGYSLGLTRHAAPPMSSVRNPDIVLVPGTTVYMVQNSAYDMFRYSSDWYLCTGEHWYRARTSSGPFRAIDVRSVPRAVLRVPPGHWKHPPKGWKKHPHGGPPGLQRS